MTWRRAFIVLIFLTIAYSARLSSKSQKGVFKKWWIGPKQIRDVREKLEPGAIFVPVIGRDQRRYGPYKDFSDKRYSMFCDGVYPGVEFELLDTVDDEDGDTLLTIRPAYDLIPQLERDWPVTVSLKSIPFVLTRGMYNAITIIGSASLAVSMLLVAFGLSQTFTFSVVNSRSMMPTIQPKDVILVDKVTPQFKKALSIVPKKDEVVFFRKPEALGRFIKDNKLPPVGEGDLFVKRVAKVTQASDGSSSCLYVLGDNPRYSVDSRDFGCFPPSDLVGSPVGRVFPLNRIGLLGPPPAREAPASAPP